MVRVEPARTRPPSTPATPKHQGGAVRPQDDRDEEARASDGDRPGDEGRLAATLDRLLEPIQLGLVLSDQVVGIDRRRHGPILEPDPKFPYVVIPRGPRSGRLEGLDPDPIRGSTTAVRASRRVFRPSSA